jgi:hypothetical protein
VLSVVSGLLLGLSQASPASAAVANDDRADATILADPSGSIIVSFDGATAEPDDPFPAEMTGTVWYSFTAPVTDRYSFYMYYSDVSYWASFGSWDVFVERPNGSFTTPTSVGGGYRETQYLMDAGETLLIGFAIGGESMYWGSDLGPSFSIQRAPLLHLTDSVNTAVTDSQGGVNVTGTVSCNVAADVVAVDLTVKQGRVSGTSSTSLYCPATGPVSWQLYVRPDTSGGQFKPRSAMTATLHLNGYDVSYLDWDDVTTQHRLQPT